jgi:hypothetical protein
MQFLHLNIPTLQVQIDGQYIEYQEFRGRAILTSRYAGNNKNLHREAGNYWAASLFF